MLLLSFVKHNLSSIRVYRPNACTLRRAGIGMLRRIHAQRCLPKFKTVIVRRSVVTVHSICFSFAHRYEKGPIRRELRPTKSRIIFCA